MLERLLKQPGFIYEINGSYYFLGKWICKECTESFDGLTALDRTSLTALRHIAFSEFAKLYSFTIPEKSAVILSKITEKYLTLQTDYRFSTLDFYHSIINY